MADLYESMDAMNSAKLKNDAMLVDLIQQWEKLPQTKSVQLLSYEMEEEIFEKTGLRVGRAGRKVAEEAQQGIEGEEEDDGEEITQSELTQTRMPADGGSTREQTPADEVVPADPFAPVPLFSGLTYLQRKNVEDEEFRRTAAELWKQQKLQNNAPPPDPMVRTATNHAETDRLLSNLRTNTFLGGTMQTSVKSRTVNDDQCILEESTGTRGEERVGLANRSKNFFANVRSAVVGAGNRGGGKGGEGDRFSVFSGGEELPGDRLGASSMLVRTGENLTDVGSRQVSEWARKKATRMVKAQRFTHKKQVASADPDYHKLGEDYDHDYVLTQRHNKVGGSSTTAVVQGGGFLTVHRLDGVCQRLSSGDVLAGICEKIVRLKFL